MRLFQINETLARREFGNQDPIGRTIIAGYDQEGPMTIVGVIGATRATILRMVSGEGAALAGAGMVLGVLGATAATRPRVRPTPMLQKRPSAGNRSDR